MNSQYALECNIKGKNTKIHGAISISLVTSLPPFINSMGSNHAGMSSSSSNAVGYFCPEFVTLDTSEYDSAIALTDLACNYKTRTAQKFKITRYLVIEDEAVEDFVIEFNSHYILISEIDDRTANKNHVYKLVPSQGRSEVVHWQYKLGDLATRMKSTLCDKKFLFVNREGQGIIQRG